MGSWRGGAGAAGIHAAPWDYSFLFLLLKKNVCLLLFHNVCGLLAIIRHRGSVWFYRSSPEAVYVCRVDGGRQLPKP